MQLNHALIQLPTAIANCVYSLVCITLFCFGLQEAKVQIFELNGQLERVKMDTLGELQGNGNSLFGEVSAQS